MGRGGGAGRERGVWGGWEGLTSGAVDEEGREWDGRCEDRYALVKYKVGGPRKVLNIKLAPTTTLFLLTAVYCTRNLQVASI